MTRIFGRLFQLPFHLILLGVGIGLLARLIYPPETQVIAPRGFPNPIVEPEQDFTDLPIL